MLTSRWMLMTHGQTNESTNWRKVEPPLCRSAKVGATKSRKLFNVYFKTSGKVTQPRDFLELVCPLKICIKWNLNSFFFSILIRGQQSLKYSDWQVLTNNLYPDQTAPSASTLFITVSKSKASGHIAYSKTTLSFKQFFPVSIFFLQFSWYQITWASYIFKKKILLVFIFFFFFLSFLFTPNWPKNE